MKTRMNYYPHLPDAFAKIVDAGNAAKEVLGDDKLYHLVKIRASQLNDCTFCVDMHVKEAKLDGERELRLHHLSVWKESSLFSPKERAALRWTEALTRLSYESTSNEVYEEMRQHFSEKELTALTMAIAMINTWNRFAVGFRSEHGSLDKAYGLDKANL